MCVNSCDMHHPNASSTKHYISLVRRISTFSEKVTTPLKNPPLCCDDCFFETTINEIWLENYRTCTKIFIKSILWKFFRSSNWNLFSTNYHWFAFFFNCYLSIHDIQCLNTQFYTDGNLFECTTDITSIMKKFRLTVTWTPVHKLKLFNYPTLQQEVSTYILYRRI